MAALKLCAFGKSLGVVLPKGLLARLDMGEGGTLHVVAAPDGPRLKRVAPESEWQMAAARACATKAFRRAPPLPRWASA